MSTPRMNQWKFGGYLPRDNLTVVSQCQPFVLNIICGITWCCHGFISPGGKKRCTNNVSVVWASVVSIVEELLAMFFLFLGWSSKRSNTPYYSVDFELLMILYYIYDDWARLQRRNRPHCRIARCSRILEQLLLLMNGDSMVILWWFYGDSMVIIWWLMVINGD